MRTLLVAGALIASAFCYLKFHRAHAGGQELEGRWEIVEWPEGWKHLPGSHVIIKSGEVKITAGFLPVATLRYQADGDAGTIDTTRTLGGKVTEQHGFYRVEGDLLTLSVAPEGKPRPATVDFDGDGMSKWVLRKKDRPDL